MATKTGTRTTFLSKPGEELKGFIKKSEAIKLLGMDGDVFTAKVDLGELPRPVAIRTISKSGRLGTKWRWQELEILACIPRPKSVVKYPFPPATMAMLSILKHHARKGFVSGEDVEFICGNPPDKRIWADILPLIRKKKLEVGKDNWDRITLTFVKGEEQ